MQYLILILNTVSHFLLYLKQDILEPLLLNRLSCDWLPLILEEGQVGGDYLSYPSHFGKWEAYIEIQYIRQTHICSALKVNIWCDHYRVQPL